MLQEGKIPNQAQHNPGALLVGGGLVIEAQGQIVGGIGVSGAPPGKSERDSIDGACAQAGLTAINEAWNWQTDDQESVRPGVLRPIGVHGIETRLVFGHRFGRLINIQTIQREPYRLPIQITLA